MSKKIFSALITLVAVFSFFIITHNAEAATKKATTTGNWSTLTWSPAGVPVSTDNVIINDAVNVTVNSSLTINSINFQNAANGSVTGTLTVNSPNVLTVTAGINTPSSTLVTNHKANGTYSITGTGTINTASITMHDAAAPAGSAVTSFALNSTIANLNITNNLTLNSTGNGGAKHDNNTFSLQSGTVTVGGTVTMTTSTPAVSIFTMATRGTGTLKLTGATPWNLSGTGTNTTTLTGASSAVNYGGTAQTILGTTYKNLIIDGTTGAKSITTGTLVTGNLSIASTGTSTASIGAGLNISVDTLTVGGLGTVSGTWGSTTSAATNKNNTYFAATTGIVTVKTDTRANQSTLVFAGQTVTYPTTFATLSTTGGSGTGTVSYTVTTSGTAGCSIVGSTLSYTNAGTCGVTATKAGDGDYKPTSSAEATFTINKANQATLTVTTQTVTYPTTFATLASTGGSGSGALTFALGSAGTAGCSVAGSTLSYTNAGTCTVTATKAADTNYNSATSAAQTFTVNQGTQAALILPSQTISNPATFATLSTTGGTGTGLVTYTVTTAGTAGCSISSATLSYTLVGTCGVTATKAADINYNSISSTETTFTINQTTFTLTYTTGSNGSITGTSPQTVNYNGSGTQVTAVADSGFHFTSWSDGVVTAARTDINVVTNISVSASFEINTPVLDHFVINTISTQTAGTSFDIVITAKDNNGSTVTGFVGTVDLTTNSGSITPTTSGSFVGGVKTESVTLTGYGIGRTITATHTGGTETGTSNSFNVNSSATKFVIINPTDNTVGSNVDVTIQAQDGLNNLVSDYTGDVTLVLSGDATFVSGTGLVHLVNGTVTKSITDNTAQTVGLSLLDTVPTHLNVDSTQDVIFSPGNLHHFSFDTISSPQTASADIRVTITAKDLYGNTTTSFGGTVNFSTTAGSITPTISNNFSSGILTQNVRVTQSGGGKTITATKTGGSENGISNGFTVSPGATAKLILNDNITMTAGTRIGYTVTREDQNNNLVTSGSDTVYLSTTSGPTSKFYDAAVDGTVITQISIPDGQSSTNFWYYDDNEGTWVVTASNHTSASNGTDSIIVSIAPVVPTQFVFEVVPSATVGDTVSVSVKAVDSSNNLATSYSRTDSSLVLNSTGHSTASGAGISFNINSGVGSINISDTTAETITLSLTDNHPDVPPLSLNTQDLTFNPGVFDHFSMDTISSPQTAGSDIGVTITAKDSHNNTATSFGGTVDFSTTAGSITPTISNNFSSGVLTQNVRVTRSGLGKTITATKTGDVQNFISNTFDVNPSTVANFIVEASGGGSIGTQTIGVPFDIKITAKDSFGNIATGFTDTANISSTGTLSSGGGTTASFTSGILSAHHVTVSNTGSFAITATRTVGSETGTSNSFSVSSAPIVATKFIILDPLDVQVGQSTTVTVKAVDDAGDVDSTYQGDINLVISGSATGAGLVDIVNGVGTKTISDSVIETVGLSLSDIVPPTTLIFTSTQNVIFSAVPPVISGGGGSIYIAPVPVPVITFSGQAFPTGNLTAFAISNGVVPIKQDLIKTADGKFNVNFSSGLSGTNQYGIFVTDKNGNISQVKIYTMTNGVPNLDVKGLIMSPTVSLLRTNLSKGDFLSISGYTTPNSTVLFEIDGVVVNEKVTASTDGSYSLLWNTAVLSLGKHTLRVKQTTPSDLSSEFSPTQNFNLTRYIITPTDFNSDGKINISDMSIFLSLWYNKNNPDRMKIDLNHDGKVNIQDLSIFSRTLYK